MRTAASTLSGEIFGYYPITHQYFARYRLPVMHTETNGLGGEQAVRWLKKEWANMHRLKQDGVPLIGFTWYSLQDQVDWDTGLRGKQRKRKSAWPLRSGPQHQPGWLCLQKTGSCVAERSFGGRQRAEHMCVSGFFNRTRERLQVYADWPDRARRLPRGHVT